MDALTDAVLGIYRARVTPELSIRRVNIALADLMPVDKVQSTLFDDAANERKQAALSRAMVDVRKCFGANALLKATSLKEEANAMERNNQVGGHRGPALIRHA